MSASAQPTADSNWTSSSYTRPDNPLRAIAGRTVYFGHQSVGRDVIAGVARLNDEQALGLRIIQTADPSSVAGPAFIHFRAGINRDYASKNAALLRMLQERSQPDGAIVLLKYCYVDLTASADSDAVFAAYSEMVETITFEHPDVTLVHTTIPLTTVESLVSAGAKQFLGRPTFREAAVARHRYNALVRAEFGGDQPLFDLARVESTRPDGTLATFKTADAWIETLASENTSDGGHITPECQLTAAAALLNVLVEAIRASRARVS
jgi:hypothetical protein